MLVSPVGDRFHFKKVDDSFLKEIERELELEAEKENENEKGKESKIKSEVDEKK